MKKLKLITTLSSIGLTAAITPIVATSCSSTNNNGNDNGNSVKPIKPTTKPNQPDHFYPDYDLDLDMGVDSIPGPVQPEEDIDTDMQVPSFGPVQPEEDIDTDMGVDSIPGPVQPDEEIDTDINVDIDNSLIVNIEYNELIALKKANNLVAGQSYRITDYVATTSKTEWSIAANNKFDIIVTALNENALSEDAKAIQSKADIINYFANSNLAAWNIKYCLENDTNRFEWATSNGKGVIFYMKDEFGNEAPYDFKNLKFKPYFDAKNSKTKYNSNFFCYTFASSYTADNTDLSISKSSKVYWNSLGTNESFYLPRIVLFGTETFNNKFADGCKEITFGSKLTTDNGISYYKGYNFGNNFGQYCEKMTFESSSHSNTFGQKNLENYFGSSCYYNTFGIWNWGNVFGDEARFNTFGNNNYSNTFGNQFWSNSVSNDCRNNKFGNGCWYNELGNNSYQNTIGNNCLGNLFAINCVGVTLKDNTSNTKINL